MEGVYKQIEKANSEIVDFYKGKIPDSEGRMIHDIYKYDYSELEYSHDYIQWLFPLNTYSRFNESAPVLNDNDIIEFQKDETIKNNLINSLRILLGFYGYDLVVDNLKIIIKRADNFDKRIKTWITKDNHNFLRITRILICLKLAKLDDYAELFFNELKSLYDSEFKEVIGAVTFDYWENAIKVFPQ
jgi:hypothetical protein